MTPELDGRVVILDRDGTIVADRHYLSEPEQLEFLAGAVDGLRAMQERGHRLIVVTNQSGVGRGLFTIEQMNAVHERLRTMVSAVGIRIDGIYACPHSPDAGCGCRKPEPGLVAQAAAELRFDPRHAVVIGDKDSDVELGKRIGAITILIGAERRGAPSPTPDFVVADLLQASAEIGGLSAAVPGGSP
jgi:D-glycero-D-manno-heptose 1,7-bisphosphate phosphatase